MENFNLYRDIKARTDGEIYIGVVGPVRTGKSTFIKGFINLMVLPGIDNPNEKERIIDEMPQSAAGKTVMTTEPKFIPKEAVTLNLGSGIKASFRLIDCVGFLINGAQGIYEDDKERLVKTPWFRDEIPFTKAAEYGTNKVIKDHSTIGIAITTDGSISGIPRENYLEAEEKTIMALKRQKKPFIVVVNTTNPAGNTAEMAVKSIKEKYEVEAMAVDCEHMNKDDIANILTAILKEFPVLSIEFYLPKWVEMLPNDNEIKADIIKNAAKIIDSITYIKDITTNISIESQYVSKIKFEAFDFSTGVQRININVDDKYYYENLTKLCGEQISDEYELISMIKSLSVMKKEYERYCDAVKASMNKGYGVVMPNRDEIVMSEPEIIKNGNKFGVKIKAQSPSVHMINGNIGTEISPIVGSEEQAKDLVRYINDNSSDKGAWDTNIFGKSIGELIEDGIKSKIRMINDESQVKLQDTMQKVVNESSGGLVCLII